MTAGGFPRQHYGNRHHPNRITRFFAEQTDEGARFARRPVAGNVGVAEQDGFNRMLMDRLGPRLSVGSRPAHIDPPHGRRYGDPMDYDRNDDD